jgi:ribosomal protein L12E/L44/L45/RPP1/RPP2
MTQVFSDAGSEAEQQWRAIMQKLADTKFEHLLSHGHNPPTAVSDD